jgi:hypothetical protein
MKGIYLSYSLTPPTASQTQGIKRGRRAPFKIDPPACGFIYAIPYASPRRNPTPPMYLNSTRVPLRTMLPFECRLLANAECCGANQCFKADMHNQFIAAFTTQFIDESIRYMRTSVGLSPEFEDVLSCTTRIELYVHEGLVNEYRRAVDPHLYPTPSSDTPEPDYDIERSEVYARVKVTDLVALCKDAKLAKDSDMPVISSVSMLLDVVHTHDAIPIIAGMFTFPSTSYQPLGSMDVEMEWVRD